MPQRAPSYYHWSMDKPCTTNETYGFSMKNAEPVPTTRTIPDPFSYTRPFSNCGFFPQITYKNRLTTAVLPRPSLRPTKEYHPQGSTNRFDINRGYSMGYTPVTDKIQKRDIPAGFKLSRSVTAPEAFRPEQPRGKDLFLWHTLSGTLVHCKNYPPKNNVSQSVAC